MRAAVLHVPKDIRLEQVDEPSTAAGHATVKVDAVGVCGSDLPRMLVKGAHRMPLICGHEFSGRISALGSGLSGFDEGELVAVPPMLPCRVCVQCLQGQFSRCSDYDYFGSRRDGAYAEYVSVPASNLLKVPPGLDARAVAMVDPASIALHAIWKAGGTTAGRRGAVIGCGPIGLFAIQWLKLMGADDIVAVDVSAEKLALAEQAGASHMLMAGADLSAAPRADLVVEAAGRTSSIDAALRLAAPGGHVVCIGIPVGNVELDNAAFQHLLRQEVSMHGSWNSFGTPFPGPQWTVTLDKMASGELAWEFMISHELELEALPRMFERFEKERELHFSKVIFRP